MKLSIAILSSILLACSVTVANPVLTSSTTSTATTTSSAYPSATETSGPDLTKLFDPYSVYMSDCYPIDFDGITLIESLANGVRRLERLLQDTSEKKTEIKDQVEVVSKLKEKFDHLKSDPSSSKSEIIKLKSKLVGSIGIFKSLKRQMKELIKEYSHTNQQNAKTRAMLGDYFTKHHSVGSTNSDGTINTEPYPGFKKCFDHFYYRLPQ
ncbi:hypothetical protein O5D80_001525 [Batrachochytrium dendrobatidis]|nr:hypothetical protein O5D80_001525 [Batrachochytrium dendrobatidis]